MWYQPKVSVIIIFFNAVEFLQEAVESVLAQTYQHWELLLVDDGSTDGSSELAIKYTSQDSLRIYYIEHEQHQNRGMSESRNLGIRNARGDYVAFLDADDYWVPERLENHVRILDSFPDVGMLYGSAKYWFSWTGRPQDRERDFVPELRVHGNTVFDPPELLPLLLEGKAEVPCTCSILVRKEIAHKIGGFEESFRGMYEDQAFYAKICLSTTVLAIDDCLAWYRQHPKSHSAVVVRSGELISAQYSFLKWLESYCTNSNIVDTTVLETIRRKLWLNQRVSVSVPFLLTPRTVFWLKKWILRLESRILPSKMRGWLWMRR